MKVQKGERILINGPQFALKTMESIAIECLECEAKPILISWTDLLLKKAFTRFPAESVANIVAFGCSSTRDLESFGVHFRKVDKLVLFSDFFEDVAQFQNTDLNIALFNFYRAIPRIFWNLVSHRQYCLLLDHPSQTSIERMKLNYEYCQKAFHDAVDVDYGSLQTLNNRIAKILDYGESVQITTDSGTDLSFKIVSRSSIRSNGTMSEEKFLVQLPDGEVYIAPIEESVHGKAMLEFLPLKTKFCVGFEYGHITEIQASSHQERITAYFERSRLIKERVGEFGIGTNPKAIPLPFGSMIEKVLGSCHIAFGRNLEFGGKNQSELHQDFLIFNPTVKVDHQILLENGKLKI